MAEPDLRVISLGAGIQSSAMYLLACHGEIGPRPDYAVFADTGAEPHWVYSQLENLRRHGAGMIPIVRTGRITIDSQGNVIGLNSDPDALPLRVRTADGRAGFTNRDCTRDYKLRPIKAAVRSLLGLEPGERAAGRFHVEQWLGISVDEAQRAKQSRDSWITLRYPLLFDRPMRRGDCVAWLERHGYEVPRRSACWFCPFHSDAEWRALREEPELWARIVAFDHRLREPGTLRGLSEPAYLHGSLVPIDQADLSDSRTADLFGNECEGMCGV